MVPIIANRKINKRKRNKPLQTFNKETNSISSYIRPSIPSIRLRGSQPESFYLLEVPVSSRAKNLTLHLPAKLTASFSIFSQVWPLASVGLVYGRIVRFVSAFFISPPPPAWDQRPYM